MARCSAPKPGSSATDEAARLAALAGYELLDTVAEEEFDALTRLAAQLCDAPTALISLVDAQRQWFKSCVGLDVQETPRSQSFCAHAIAADSLMEVPDARDDLRFADNPLVVGPPYIRFYAGMPLMVAGGHRLGTLCVIDSRPRRLEAAQRRGLEDLARLAVQLIERRAQTRRAQAREALLDSLLEAMPEGIVASDAAGQLNLFNSRARDWHGSGPLATPPEQWTARFDLYEADGETPLALERIPLMAAWKGETVRDREICIKAEGQPLRRVICNGQAFFDADGTRLGAVVAMHDVTERARYQRQVDGIRRRLQAVIDASTEVAIIATDRVGLISLFNPGAERLLGYSADEVVGHYTPLKFHLPEEVERHAAELSQLYGEPVRAFEALTDRPRRGGNESGDWTFVERDGGHRQVRLVVSAIRDCAGLIDGFLGVAIDRSQLQAMEQALKLSEAQFRVAFDTAPQGMALVSLEGRFIEVNRTLCTMLGFEREALLTTEFQHLTHPDDLALDLDLVGQLIRDEIPQYQLTKRYFTQDGKMLWGLLSVSLVRDGKQRPLYFVSQIQDVTEQRQLDRLKSEFVAVVSHELRTPLTSIKGALALINGGVMGEVPGAINDMLGLAQRNTERLGQLVDDLLDWEKLAADKLAFEFRTLDLRELLEDALASNRGYADSYGVHLALQGAARVSVEVDGLRFGQVMANLLSNAIKFSPPGETVTVDYRVAAGRVLVEVCDRGPGVPEAFHERLFQHFAQAESGNTRRQGGTGLGLAISKQLVEHMHGDIGFDSVSGQGARFWFSLPVAS
ncbi:PAS domain S-box protein [Halomonas sp. HP20-15]|uniref:PAS domain S-box protein n=1 Tax=Halomonas sp. HP20-15 TaxID=3085901 RepID=UPI002982230F|nr:PAS domain S-box protein [Halomonas sp. HP20-15]MDW5377491.1 PAS domain S-box protein [Halomonas sp. HP20-15]